MLYSFACPGCGKGYELPWSMVGRMALCKGCATQFRIPAPLEPIDPRTMMAIPIATRILGSLEPPPISFPVLETPPKQPKPPARHEDGPEPTRPRPTAWNRYPDPTPPREPEFAPPRRAQAPRHSEPVPAWSSSRFESKPTPIPPPSRPRWLIPAIASGGFASILMLNVVLFFLFVPRGDLAERVETIPAEPLVVAQAPAMPPEVETQASLPPTGAVQAPRSATPGPAPRPVESSSDRPMSTADIVARYESSVALIKGKKGSGTGFLARPGIVATNAHVIDGERIKDVEVRFPSAEEARQGPYAARLLFRDKERDLALLGVAADLPPVDVVEAYQFRKGEDVTVIGNPGVGGRLILENAISRGIVSSMTKINEQSFIQLGIAINPGNSGGPVFDPKGRVIGIVTLKTTRQEGLAFAIPAEDLRSALDVAQSVAASPPTDPDGSSGGPPDLNYAWKAGQTYAYSFEVTIGESPSGVVLSGSSVYTVKGVDAEGITLSHRGWVITTERGKDGKVPPGGIRGPTATNAIELKLDPKGNVLKASGSAQLPLLGDLSMLIIEPFPDEPTTSWDDSRTITLREIQQTPGASGVGPRLGRPGLDNLPTGPRSRLSARPRLNSRLRGRQAAPQPQPKPPTQVTITNHEAGEETAYTLGEVQGDQASIRKEYELATRELVGDEPRLKMTGEGTIAFDLKAGVPLAMDYKVEVVEISDQARFRVPIKVVCKLLEGKERELALRPPAHPPSAMNPIDPGDLDKILADLKSPDTNRRKVACQSLYHSAPIEGRRGDVAREIERLVPEKDMGLRSDAVKASGDLGRRPERGDPPRDPRRREIWRPRRAVRGPEPALPHREDGRGHHHLARQGQWPRLEGPPRHRVAGRSPAAPAGRARGRPQGPDRGLPAAQGGRDLAEPPHARKDRGLEAGRGDRPERRGGRQEHRQALAGRGRMGGAPESGPIARRPEAPGGG